VSQLVARSSERIGIDFFQFWSVPTAIRLTGQTLGTPYAEGRRYHTAIREYASASDQRKLRLASRFWAGPDFAGSPLLYTVFSLLTSNDYAASLGVFQVLQVVAFVGASLLLGWLFRFDPLAMFCMPLVCLAFFQPLLSDLRVANLGSMQFALVAGLLALAIALPRVSSFALRAGLGAVLLVVAAGVTLIKPNIVLVGALLTVHLAVCHGVRLFAIAAVAAVPATAMLLALSSLFFGSWAVWPEWYRFVFGANPRMLVRSVADGNYSTPLLLSSWLGSGVWSTAFLLLVLLAVSAVTAVVSWQARAGGRTALGFIRGVVTRGFEDPRAVVAAAVLLTIATSPLCWAHYYVLVLAPALWLLSVPSIPAAALAAVGVLMAAGAVAMPLWAAGWTEATAVTIAFSWVPLWAALLVVLAGGGPPPAVEVEAEPSAPRGRRRRK
jgi:hypothetical protein